MGGGEGNGELPTDQDGNGRSNFQCGRQMGGNIHLSQSHPPVFFGSLCKIWHPSIRWKNGGGQGIRRTGYFVGRAQVRHWESRFVIRGAGVVRASPSDGWVVPGCSTSAATNPMRFCSILLRVEGVSLDAWRPARRAVGIGAVGCRRSPNRRTPRARTARHYRWQLPGAQVRAEWRHTCLMRHALSLAVSVGLMVLRPSTVYT